MSYCTVSEADTYHSARLHNSEYKAASNEDKEAALEWASTILDLQSWKGSRASAAQDHAFPRYGLTYDGLAYSDSEIPALVKDAAAELALHLLKGDRTAESGTEGIGDIKVGSIAIKATPADRTGTLPRSVKEMIRPLLSGGGKGIVFMDDRA